jgi:hypothetical protein
MILEKEIVIVGLDGVLAFIEHRLRHLQQEDGTQNWDRFYENVVDDVPALPLIAILNDLYKEGYEVVIITGRSSVTREETLQWLRVWGVLFHAIWMRPADDYTPAVKYKQAILEQHYEGRVVVRAYENDHHDDVCRMLRARGIPCIQTSRNLGNGESKEEIETRNIEHSCGHVSVARFHGDDSYEWDSIASRAASEPCVVCLIDKSAHERVMKAAAARVIAAEMGLPPLEGTPRQVEWAEGIRQASFSAIDRVHEWMSVNNDKAMQEDPDHWDSARSALKKAINLLKEQCSAKWWIDHARTVRSDLQSGRALISSIADEMGYW